MLICSSLCGDAVFVFNSMSSSSCVTDGDESRSLLVGCSSNGIAADVMLASTFIFGGSSSKAAEVFVSNDVLALLSIDVSATGTSWPVAGD